MRVHPLFPSWMTFILPSAPMLSEIYPDKNQRSCNATPYSRAWVRALSIEPS
jgi:hypothetical protein